MLMYKLNIKVEISNNIKQILIPIFFTFNIEESIFLNLLIINFIKHQSFAKKSNKTVITVYLLKCFLENIKNSMNKVQSRSLCSIIRNKYTVNHRC